MKPAFRIASMFVLGLLLQSAIAQEIQPEYGDFSEIQGKHKVFLRCNDIEYRNEIIKLIQEYIGKGKIEATIVGREEDAEITISYWNAGSKGQFGGYKKLGDLIVGIDGKQIDLPTHIDDTKQYRFRIIYSVVASKSYNNYGIGVGKSPAKGAIKKFLDEWSKFQKSNKK